MAVWGFIWLCGLFWQDMMTKLGLPNMYIKEGQTSLMVVQSNGSKLKKLMNIKTTLWVKEHFKLDHISVVKMDCTTFY